MKNVCVEGGGGRAQEAIDWKWKSEKWRNEQEAINQNERQQMEREELDKIHFF